MRKLAPVLVLLLSACASRMPASAPVGPADQAAVMATVHRLFDAMRAGDSTAARSVFLPDASMASVSVRDGVPTVQRGSVDRFVQAIGTPHDQVWDEKIWNPEVRVDGDLATAWMDYAFYLGDRFSHCGVDAFQMLRTSEGWKIFHLADTRRQEPCGTGSRP